MPLMMSVDRDVLPSLWHGLRLCALIFGFLGPGVIRTPAATIHVDHSATGLNNGSSWQDAFTDLAEACNLAAEGDEIWVAEGTYTPTTTGDRFAGFRLKSRVGLFGGFDGHEARREERRIAEHPTILSGDIGVLGYRPDNCYHVITVASVEEVTLSGMTIRDGYTQTGCGEPERSGGGIDVFFSANVKITNCIIEDNFGAYGGGLGVSKEYAQAVCSVLVDRCVFRHNSSLNGGGIQVQGSSYCRVSNSLFVGNSAVSRGGGIQNNYSISDLVNCTFYGNTAGSGNSVLHYCGMTHGLNVTNCILWNSASQAQCDFMVEGPAQPQLTVVDCCIKEVSLLTGLVDEFVRTIADDPAFVDPNAGNFRLLFNSPCLSRGSNLGSMAGPFDLEGAPRLANGAVDLGAYESPRLGARIEMNGSSVCLVVIGPAGADCRIDSSSHLRDWVTFTNITLSSTPFRIDDAVAAGERCRFYRVLHEP